ncbi:response regulator [Paenibacillaceae bacterium WGS1546]|uniref:response regulator n=1 Tax=Cohnella sp. WGS1546 TaxID=3366810 RepID=UPI00372D1C72
MNPTLLIVDDEKIERNGIKLLIGKYALPFEVREAAGGEEAYEWLQRNSADILLTDIKMRRMDGLELAGKAKELHPDLHVVIFSAFGEFEYAKQALSVGAFHYLLKPIDIGEFLSVMGKVRESWTEVQAVREREKQRESLYRQCVAFEKMRFWTSRLSGSETGVYPETGGEPDSVQLVLIETSRAVFGSRWEEAEDAVWEAADRAAAEFDTVPLNERQLLVILKRSKLRRSGERTNFNEAAAKRLAERMSERIDDRSWVVVGEPDVPVRDLQSQYEGMDAALDDKFFLGGSVILYGRAKEVTDGTAVGGGFCDSGEMTLERVVASIREGRSDQAAAGLNALFERMRDSGYSALYTKYAATQLLRAAHEARGLLHTEGFRVRMEQLYRCGHLDELIDVVRTALEAAWTSLPPAPDHRPVNRKIIADVLDYLHANYMNDIGLESAAHHIHYSPGYLSHLFKTSMNMNLMKYLTAYRMRKAAEMLSSTPMRVHEVGARVGYPNLSYFCLLFNNHYGMTPAKYRESGGTPP